MISISPSSNQQVGWFDDKRGCIYSKGQEIEPKWCDQQWYVNKISSPLPNVFFKVKFRQISTWKI